MNQTPKSRRRFFRFRIKHLLVGMVLVGPAIWLVNESSMATAKLRIDAMSQFEASYSIDIRWVSPDDLSNSGYRVFGELKALSKGNGGIGEQELQTELKEGTTFSFRYRKSRLFWLPPDSPNEIAIKLLMEKLYEVEEIILEHGDAAD